MHSVSTNLYIYVKSQSINNFKEMYLGKNNFQHIFEMKNFKLFAISKEKETGANIPDPLKVSARALSAKNGSDGYRV